MITEEQSFFVDLVLVSQLPFIIIGHPFDTQEFRTYMHECLEYNKIATHVASAYPNILTETSLQTYTLFLEINTPFTVDYLSVIGQAPPPVQRIDPNYQKGTFVKNVASENIIKRIFGTYAHPVMIDRLINVSRFIAGLNGHMNVNHDDILKAAKYIHIPNYSLIMV